MGVASVNSPPAVSAIKTHRKIMAERLNLALEFLEECGKVRYHPDAKVGEAIGVLVAMGN